MEIFYLFHVWGSVVLRVVKVLGVGVTVEVGLHGVNFFVGMVCWMVKVFGVGVTVEVGIR
jgi:hypothetical protein